MKTYTVAELCKVLNKAVEDGKGDLIILVPNNDEDIDAAYATLGSVEFDTDMHAEYVYFDGNGGEEEEEFWKEKEDE